jgi:hypothetical protein
LLNFIRRHAVAIALGPILTVAFVATFWPLLETPGDFRFFGYGDSWLLYGPSQFFLDRSIHSGEFPLWNPLILTGQPIAGNPECLLFYPPNLLRSLLTLNPTPFRTHVGMAILQWLHVLIAAYGTYATGRALSQSSLAAGVAGFAFSFSAALSGRVFGHHFIVYVVAWWPVALFCLHCGMHAEPWRARIRWALLLGAAFALSLLGGSPQMAYLTAFGLAVYWLVARADLAIDVTRKAAPREQLLGAIRGDVAVGGVAVVFALSLAAALLGPAWDFSRFTPRGGGAAYESALGDDGWSLFDLLSVYTGSATYEGFKTLSATGLLLGLIALFSRKWRPALRLLAVSLLLIDASRDASVFMLNLVIGLAPFPITAAPRAMLIACLPLALLAGYGVDALRTDRAGRTMRVSGGIAIAALGAAMLWAVYEKITAIQFNVSYVVLLFPAAIVVAILIRLAGARFTWVISVIVLGVVAEPVYWGHHFVQNLTRSPEMFFRLGDGVARSRPEFWLGNSRGVSHQHNVPISLLQPEINGYQALYLSGILELLDPGSKQHPFRRGVDPFTMAQRPARAFLLLKRSFWLHREYVSGEIPEASRAFPPATTAYLRDPGQLAVPEVRADSVRNSAYSAEARSLTVTNRPSAFDPNHHPTLDEPLIWQIRTEIPPEHKTLGVRYKCDAQVRIGVVARTSEGDKDFQLIAVATLEPTFGLSSRVSLPMPDLEELKVGLVVDFPSGTGNMTIVRVELIVDGADEVGRIHVVDRTANTAEVELQGLPGPRILSHIDFMYPGWHAYLDGEKVPIMRAFSHFKAVEVPAGTHRVRFQFRPRIVYVCVAFSLLSLVVWTALLLWTRRRPKSAGPA